MDAKLVDPAPPRVVVAARPRLRAAVRAALLAAGCALVAECADASAAVAAAAREHPDACILDAALPGGALVAAAAIAQPPSPPRVLVLAEHGSEPELRAARLAGASAYVRGEPDATPLADELARLLDPSNPRRTR